MTKGSARQAGAAVFTALLAPAAALPAVLAREGGALGWLGPAAVLPLAGAAGLWLRRLGGRGLGEVMKGPWSHVLLTLYYIWALGLAAMTAGSCVDRLCRTDYAAAPPWLLALGLGAVTWYLIRRGEGAFLRAAELFWLVLIAVLGAVTVLGAANLEWENLTPTAAALPQTAAGWIKTAAAPIGALSVGGLALFLPREREEGRRWAWLWPAGWCGAAAVLTALVLGALGAPLTAAGPQPFFLALQGMGVQGGFQRLEAAGTALWCLSDLVLMGLAALACRRMAGDRKGGHWPAVGAAFLGGWLLHNGELAPFTWVFYGINALLGGAVPLILAWRTGRKKEGEGLSCG